MRRIRMSLPPHHPRDPVGWCAAIALGFLALVCFRLGIPSKPYFDEIHYLPAARALLAGSDWLNREHPMFGKEVIAAGIGLFGDHAGIVEIGRTGRVALDAQIGARPYGQTRTPPAAPLVAHDVAPFAAIDDAMSVGKGRHVLVQGQLVARADQVTNFVGQRVGCRRALVMHHRVGLFGIGVLPTRTRTRWSGPSASSVKPSAIAPSRRCRYYKRIGSAPQRLLGTK